jgi:hypothetical protein
VGHHFSPCRIARRRLDKSDEPASSRSTGLRRRSSG